MSARPVHPAARREVHAAILVILPDLAPTDIDESRHLKDLGADSIDRVEIITEVLHRLGLTEPMSSFSELPTIRALIELVNQLQERVP